MKIPAIALAVVLSAASMWAQALVGYAGAASSSATAAAGSAKKIGDAGMGRLSRKMASATGQSATGSGTHPGVQGQPTSTRVHTDAHSPEKTGMPCNDTKRDAHCPPENQGSGKEPIAKEGAVKDPAGKQELKITFVGAK